MPNTILPINPSSDARSQIAQTNANFAKLDNDTITKVYKGPTGKDAVIEGQLPNNLGSGILMNDLNGVPNIYMATDQNGQPILKVAKAGQDATTASGSGLIFNSSQNIFKIAATGDITISVTAPASGTSQQFAGFYTHNRGTPPIALAFWESAFNTREMLPIYMQGFNSSLNAFTTVTQLRLITTPTDLQITVIATSNTFSADYKFHWYILEETAA